MNFKDEDGTRTLDQKKPECKVCNKDFANSSSLTRHTKEMHLSFKCKTCDIEFRRKARLMIHVRTSLHETDPDLEQQLAVHRCKECPKVFRKVNRLDEHVNKDHKRLRAHKCGQCPKEFNMKAKLDSHVHYTHMGLTSESGGTLLECHVCHKLFIDRYSLNTRVSQVVQ